MVTWTNPLQNRPCWQSMKLMLFWPWQPTIPPAWKLHVNCRLQWTWVRLRTSDRQWHRQEELPSPLCTSDVHHTRQWTNGGNGKKTTQNRKKRWKIKTHSKNHKKFNKNWPRRRRLKSYCETVAFFTQQLTTSSLHTPVSQSANHSQHICVFLTTRHYTNLSLLKISYKLQLSQPYGQQSFNNPLTILNNVLLIGETAAQFADG